MTIEDTLPEGTVVIRDISQLALQSQELFKRYGWTLEDFQNRYHEAQVLGQRLKTDAHGLLVPTSDNSGYQVDNDLEQVLKEKARTGESCMTLEKARELFAAVAVQYIELYDKRKPVSINGTARENRGFFPLKPQMTNIDWRIIDMHAQVYMHEALSPDKPFNYVAR